MVLRSSKIHWGPLQSHHPYWYHWAGLRAPPCFYFNENIFTGPNFHRDREFSGWDSPEQKPPESERTLFSSGFQIHTQEQHKNSNETSFNSEAKHGIKPQSRVRYRKTGQVCWQDHLVRCRQQKNRKQRRCGWWGAQDRFDGMARSRHVADWQLWYFW